MLKNIGYWFLRRVLKYSSPLLNLWGNMEVKRYSEDRDTFQPVFIVGSPRSGSTILYQLITNYLDVIYIDNLMNMSREAPWFGMWLSSKVFGNKQHNSFESKHGRTIESGLHAPNEGLFWYKWLPKDTHFVKSGQISQKNILKIQDLVYAMMNKNIKPIIFKNLSFSMRLEFIRDAFPKAKIIYLKRDPVYVAQSIFLARKKNRVAENEVWSINPKNCEVLTKMPEIKHVVLQTYLIEQQIHKDLKLFPFRHKLSIEYENLYNSMELINNLAFFINSNICKMDGSVKIKNSNKQKTEDTVFKKIIDEVTILDWNSFSTNI